MGLEPATSRVRCTLEVVGSNPVESNSFFFLFLLFFYGEGFIPINSAVGFLTCNLNRRIEIIQASMEGRVQRIRRRDVLGEVKERGVDGSIGRAVVRRKHVLRADLRHEDTHWHVVD